MREQKPKLEATRMIHARLLEELHKSISLTKTEVLGGPYQALPQPMMDRIYKDFGY